MITYHGLRRYDNDVLRLKIFAEVAYSDSSFDVSFPSSEFDFEVYSELQIDNFLDSYNPPELDYLNSLTFDNELSKRYYIRTEKFKKIPIGSLYSLNCFQVEKLRKFNEFLCMNFGTKHYLISVGIGYFSLVRLKIVFLSDILEDYFVLKHCSYSGLEGRITFNPYELVTYAGIYNLPYLKEIYSSNFYIKYLGGVRKPVYSYSQLAKAPQLFREAIENQNISDMNQLNSSLARSRYFKLLPSDVEAFFVIPTLVTYNNHNVDNEDVNITFSSTYVNQFAGFWNFGNPMLFHFGVPTQYDYYYKNGALIGEVWSNFVFYSYAPFGLSSDFDNLLDNYLAPPKYDPTLCCLAQCFGITN